MILVFQTHLNISQVCVPKYTFTALPALRFSPVTVTLLPPDSGPLPGVSVSIEGVCEQQSFTEELFHNLDG